MIPGRGHRADRRGCLLHHVQVRQGQPFQVPGVDVGGDDLACGAHALGQPGGHGPAASADLQAPPAGPHQVMVAAGAGIEELLQQVQPLIFGFSRPTAARR